MPSENTNMDLVARVRANDEAAANKVFHQYAEQLARMAECHLSRQTVRRVDGDDVVQSVFRTFFARVERGEFQINSHDVGGRTWKRRSSLT